MKWFKGSSTWINWLVAGTAAVATLAISSWYRYVREAAPRPSLPTATPPGAGPAATPPARSAPPEKDAGSKATTDEATTDEAATDEAATDEVTTDYASWTKAELYERARTLDIRGRSSMNKAELMEALRAHERASAPAAPRPTADA